MGVANQVSDITMGDPIPPKPGEPPPDQVHAGTNAVTSKEGGSQVGPKKMRSFAEILADEKENRNILEIKLTKIHDDEQEKVENLSLERI